jgi:hypothetical protein
MPKAPIYEYCDARLPKDHVCTTPSAGGPVFDCRTACIRRRTPGDEAAGATSRGGVPIRCA